MNNNQVSVGFSVGMPYTLTLNPALFADIKNIHKSLIINYLNHVIDRYKLVGTSIAN
jgi:hypothetical protein